MEAERLIVLDEIVQSNLKKYILYGDSPEEQKNGEELFRYLLQNKIYIDGFASDCKSLVGSERYCKPVMDIYNLDKSKAVVFAEKESPQNDIIRTVYRVNPILDARHVVIWGTGDNGKAAYEMLSDIGMDIICFIDTNKENQFQKINGVPVCGLEVLNSLDEDTVLIEAYCRYYEMDEIVRAKYPHLVKRFYCDVYSSSVIYQKPGQEKVLFHISDYDRMNLDNLRGKSVKIYGTGEDAIELSCYLKLLDLNFTAYLSDDENGLNIDGYPIEQVEEVLYEDNYAIWILCENVEKAKKRLKELGVCLDLDVVMPRKRRTILDVNMGYTYDIDGYYAGMMVYGQERRKNYKIVTLGGSTTDGAIWKYIKSWPHCLYEKFYRKDITIYNAGVSGYASGQELIRLIRDVLPLKPDMVLVYDGVNDSASVFVTPDEPYSSTYAKMVYEFGARHLDEQPLEKLGGGDILINHGVKPTCGRFGNWLSNMESMQAVCAAKGISFYGFMQPMLLSKADYNDAEQKTFEQSEGTHSYMAGFRKMMKECSIEESHPYLHDLSHIFDNHYDVYFHLDACHVYEKGNRIIADEIYKRISDEIIAHGFGKSDMI